MARKKLKKKKIIVGIVLLLTLFVGGYFLSGRKIFSPKEIILTDNSFYLGNYKDCKAIFLPITEVSDTIVEDLRI